MEVAISRYEQENLNPRSWLLSGEVSAQDRDPDSLLQHYIEADFRATQAPEINEETNIRIEAIIKKRIRDKNFEDVVRTKRVDESLQKYRASTNIDEIERKTLIQMYENEYRKKSEEIIFDANRENAIFDANRKEIIFDANREDQFEQLDSESNEVRECTNSIFSKLDALCHYQYRPTEIQGGHEVIVNKLAVNKLAVNKSTVNLEEIGQKSVAIPEEEYLAPEEVSKHSKFVPQSKEEQSKTDKLRERRNKKKKQMSTTRKRQMKIQKNSDKSKKIYESKK